MLNTTSRESLLHDLAELRNQVKTMESVLSGKIFSTQRIRDLGITNAKVVSITADKITAGTLDVGEYILIGDNILIGEGVIRITLPDPGGGYYDPFTDTNLDHYSLYSDTDNVLIKEKAHGSGHMNDGSGGFEKLTVSHNLGYIPLSVSYGKFNDPYIGGDVWNIINNSYNPFVVPIVLAASDEYAYYINLSYWDGSGMDYAYHVFFDDMREDGSPAITESDSIIKVVRPGKSRTSLNPNDSIMHSDLNNFKILKQGTILSQSLQGKAGVDPYGVTSIAHGANIQDPCKYFIFAKFPDGKTTLLSGLFGASMSYDESKNLFASIDATNMYIGNWGSTFTADLYYIIYGSGVDYSETFSDPLIGVANNSLSITDALASGNPDNFKFLSTKPSLKYFDSDSYEMTVSDTTVHTIAHGLAYTPVIIPFVSDFAGVTNSIYGGDAVFSLAPFYYGRSIFFDPLKDLAAFVYWDSTNIYLKAYYQANAVGESNTFKFYWKIFKNDTGL